MGEQKANKNSRLEAVCRHLQSTVGPHYSALGLRAPTERARLVSPVPRLDQHTGGLPQGAITELIGSASSGRTSFTFATLARLTQSGECCAYLDASHSFDGAAA